MALGPDGAAEKTRDTEIFVDTHNPVQRLRGDSRTKLDGS